MGEASEWVMVPRVPTDDMRAAWMKLEATTPKNGHATEAMWTAMLAAAPQPDVDAGGWQPIETAPRDGTAFDVWCVSSGGFRIADVVWEQRYDAFYSEGFGMLSQDISHWMPLPAPPSERGRESSRG